MIPIVPKRFVILHHQVGSGFARTDQDHFDWMFETGPTLTTFATPVLDDLHSVTESTCSRLADHRIEYLEFEGRLPDKGDLRNRGQVTRIASGVFEVTEKSPDNFSALLSFDLANKNTSSVEFRRHDHQRWSMRLIP